MDLSRSSEHDVIYKTRGSPSGSTLQIDITSLFHRRRQWKRWIELDIELTDSSGRRVDNVLSTPRPCYSNQQYG